MTAIVGIVDGDDVVLAADSEILFPSSWARTSCGPMDPKVFRLSDDMLVGVSGNVREAQIVRHRLKPAPLTLGRSVTEWMTTDFADALRKAYADAGSKKVVDTGVEHARGACLLVAVAGRLFSVYDDFSWCESPLGFDAVGSGGAAARGALLAFEYLRASWRDMPKIGADERALLALRAAADDNAGVREPFVVEKLRR